MERPNERSGGTDEVTRAAGAGAAEMEARAAALAFAEELVEAVADPFFVVDDASRLVLANSAAAERFGRARRAVVGESLYAVAPHLAGGAFERGLARARAREGAVTFEARSARGDREYDVRAWATTHGVAVHARDVTERRAAQAREERALAHEALRADVAAALARHGSTKTVLAAACATIARHTGARAARVWTPDEDGAMRLCAASDDVDAADAGGAPEEVTRVAAAAAPVVAPPDALAPLVVSDRVAGVLELRGVPSDPGAPLAPLASLLTQALERTRAEEALAVHARELARSNADLEQFASAASHDLQEPLRMVTSYVQLLARRYRGRLDPDADDFIAYAVDGARRMQALIHDLLAYSRVGRLGLELTAVESEAALGHALLALTTAIDDAGATVTHGPLPTVRANAAQLEQLFFNLVGNAIKFRGDAPPEVHVSAALDEHGMWRFAVQDNGIGIDPADAERVFAVFQRLQPRSRYEGNGIGLALCKKIVERHGGRIWVGGEEVDRGGGRRGATFFFTLPAASADAPRASQPPRSSRSERP